jgi:dUTP pyrophosphatase
MKLGVHKLTDSAVIPKFATTGSACFDLHADFLMSQRLKAYNAWNKEFPVQSKIIADKVSIQIPPETRILIPTNLVFDIPANHVMKIFVRSSIALKKGLSLSNGTGIIDSDYVDPVFVMLHNNSDTLVVVNHLERIAQGLIEKCVTTTIEQVLQRPGQKTDRDGGFGSTGS